MHPLRKSLLSVFLAAGVMAAGSAAQAATPIKIGVQAPITGQCS